MSRMQAVLLAAGKGTRMGALTESTPKALLMNNGTALIVAVLTALPRSITEIIVVIGYLGMQIKNALGMHYKDIPIRYIQQDSLNGTADALWKCKDVITGKFMVLNGDDSYNKEDLDLLSEASLGIGISHIPKGIYNFLAIEKNISGFLGGLRTPTEKEKEDGYDVATGAYTLDRHIFDYQPALLKNGEYGLPHTIALMAKDLPITIISIPNWRAINTIEDLR